MKIRQMFIVTLAALAVALLPAVPAFAVSKEIVQLQTQVQALQDQMARMQQSFDERMGIMRNLIEQSTDNVNKVNASIAALEKTLQQRHSEGATHTDQISGQIQVLNDSLDEVKVRLAKVSKQLDDMAAARENLTATAAPGAAAAPPADVLYNNALRDYNAANYELAAQQFADYMKFYGDTDLAGNAQFYLADIEFRQGNYQAAVRDYDKVLEQYPGGNKAAAAQLKKGVALGQLGQKDAAVRELNSLIKRYPKSIEATQAREQLRKMGAAPRATRR
jgi:tol-pal system protein YbgF